MTLEHQPPKITSNLADNVGLTPMVKVMGGQSNSGTFWILHYPPALFQAFSHVLTRASALIPV